MDHCEDRYLLIPAFFAWQTTRLSSNPSWISSAQDRSEEAKVGAGGGGSIAFADNISVAN
jgi:hypothetical protein